MALVDVLAMAKQLIWGHVGYVAARGDETHRQTKELILNRSKVCALLEVDRALGFGLENEYSNTCQ
jgi:hypothetical protein